MAEWECVCGNDAVEVCPVVERDEARAEAHDATVLLIHRTRERDEARAQVAEHGAILRQSSPYEVNRLRALLRECVAALRVGASPGDLETRIAAALEGRDG